jgi:hypothetical protein
MRIRIASRGAGGLLAHTDILEDRSTKRERRLAPLARSARRVPRVAVVRCCRGMSRASELLPSRRGKSGNFHVLRSSVRAFECRWAGTLDMESELKISRRSFARRRGTLTRSGWVDGTGTLSLRWSAAIQPSSDRSADVSVWSKVGVTATGDRRLPRSYRPALWRLTVFA